MAELTTVLAEIRRLKAEGRGEEDIVVFIPLSLVSVCLNLQNLQRRRDNTFDNVTFRGWPPSNQVRINASGAHLDYLIEGEHMRAVEVPPPPDPAPNLWERL